MKKLTILLLAVATTCFAGKVQLTATGATAASVSGGFDLVLVDN